MFADAFSVKDNACGNRKVLQNAGYTGKKDQSADLISPNNAKIVALFVLKTQSILEYSSPNCYHIIARDLFGGIKDDGKTGTGAV